MVVSVSAQDVVDFYFGENWEEESEDQYSEEVEEEEENAVEEEIIFSKSNSKTKVFLNHQKINPGKSKVVLECRICLTDYSDEPTSIVSIEECEHKFCKDCLSNYITFKTGDISCLYHTVVLCTQERENIFKIEQLKTYGVPCPGHNCRHVMRINELTALGTNDALQQFDRFSKIHKDNLDQLIKQENPKADPVCPRCASSKIKKNRTKRLQCLQCGCPFCTCGYAHAPSAACGTFSSNPLLWNIKGLARCPKCLIFTEKIDGCNFMSCRCSQNFCNLCSCPLDQDKHFTHFFNAPFENKCKGYKDGIKMDHT